MDKPSLRDLQAAVTATEAAFLDALTAYFTACATEHDPVLLRCLALPCCARGPQYDAALVALATELRALPDTPARTTLLGQIDQQRQRTKHLLELVHV